MKRLNAAVVLLGVAAIAAQALWQPDGRAGDAPGQAAAAPKPATKPKPDPEKNGEEKPLAKFMRAKLAASSQVLEGPGTVLLAPVADSAIRPLLHRVVEFLVAVLAFPAIDGIPSAGLRPA